MTVRVAVIPLIQQGEAILCHRRQNTGYMDGYWDMPLCENAKKSWA